MPFVVASPVVGVLVGLEPPVVAAPVESAVALASVAPPSSPQAVIPSTKLHASFDRRIAAIVSDRPAAPKGHQASAA